MFLFLLYLLLVAPAIFFLIFKFWIITRNCGRIWKILIIIEIAPESKTPRARYGRLQISHKLVWNCATSRTRRTIFASSLLAMVCSAWVEELSRYNISREFSVVLRHFFLSSVHACIFCCFISCWFFCLRVYVTVTQL